jgi:hypothetical protein
MMRYLINQPAICQFGFAGLKPDPESLKREPQGDLPFSGGSS